MNDWYINIIFLIVGGLISFLSSVGIEAWRSRNKMKKILRAIIGEIRSNIEAANNLQLYKTLWVNDIFLSNIEYLYGFKKNKIDLVVQFYALINKMKEKIEKHDELFKTAENNQDKIIIDKFHASVRSCEILASEISSLGKKILN